MSWPELLFSNGRGIKKRRIYPAKNGKIMDYYVPGFIFNPEKPFSLKGNEVVSAFFENSLFNASLPQRCYRMLAEFRQAFWESIAVGIQER